MNEPNSTQLQQEEFRIPDFIVTLIGRLQLENESLRIQLQAFQKQQTPDPTGDTS